MESAFSNLYKFKGKSKENQNSRRLQLLEKQKAERNNRLDDIRNIEISDESFETEDEEIHYPYRKYTKKKERSFKFKLQLSEWMEEKLESPENWFLVPTPKGIRCLLIKPNRSNKTVAYYKGGYYFMDFATNFPANTILDCFYNKSTKIMYILDVLVYGSMDLRSCECQFRFFWLKSKLIDDDLMTIDGSGIRFESLVYYDMENWEEIASCFDNYPMYENDEPQLDGILFYHKQSHYMEDKTPLVLWLFPFMMPELFTDHHIPIHPMYLKSKPTSYTNYHDYIKEFNENRKPKNRKKTKRESMEFEESVETEEILEDEHQENLILD